MKIKWSRKVYPAVLIVLLAVLLSGCSVSDIKKAADDLKTLALQQEELIAGEDTEAKKEVKESEKKKTLEVESEAEEENEPIETESGSEDIQAEILAEYHPDYTDNFVYQTLDDDTKQVYRETLTAILEHAEEVSVSTLDTDVLEEAYRAVCADYGGLFWVSGYVYTQYTRGGELTGMDFSPKYTMDLEERMQIQQQIDASVGELMAGISTQGSEYEKAKYVFEILVQNVDYDINAENNQNIISVFLNRATVCQGYACATQYLLRLLGMQSAIVTGNANGESHAWNLVRINGNYYFMDTTWGNSRYFDGASQMEKYVNYNYLAVTSEEISRTHLADDSFPLPECTSTEDSYFVKENRYFTDWNPEAIGGMLAEAWNAGGGDVAVKFAAAELYGQAFHYFITEQHITDYCENISSIYYLEDKELYVLTFNL